MVIDVSEMEIERPKKNRNATESGLQKCSRVERRVACRNARALKAQLLVEFESGQVIASAVDKGKTHDFKRLLRSRKRLLSSQLCLADRGSSRVCQTPCRGLYPDQETPLRSRCLRPKSNTTLALARLRVRALAREFVASRSFASFQDATAIVEGGLGCA